MFRGKFVAGLKRLFRSGKLIFAGNLKPLAKRKAFYAFLRPLFRKDWVVYAKPPFGGPEHVLHYLARYTHRVAISNHRLIAFENDQVTFRWKDYAHGNKKRKMTLYGRRVLATVSVACSAPRLRPHPLLRFPGQPAQGSPAATLPATARPAGHRVCPVQRFYRAGVWSLPKVLDPHAAGRTPFRHCARGFA